MPGCRGVQFGNSYQLRLKTVGATPTVTTFSFSQRQGRRKESLMTLHEVSTQLFTLTNGHISGEHYTKTQLESVIRSWMRKGLPETFTLKNRYVITVKLADGEWPATIDKFSDSADGYDYWIPDTMEQANAFWDSFMNACGLK